MIQVKEAVIVEGKYDKIKLSSIIDGLIIETHGFQIFKDKEQMALLRKLAAARGLLILTDSDGAGFVIRNYLSGCIPKNQIKHAYIPDLFGKEKRKAKASKEGKLGVEGVPAQVIRQALEKAGVVCGEGEAPIKKARLSPRRTFLQLGFPAGKAAERSACGCKRSWNYRSVFLPMDCCKFSTPPSAGKSFSGLRKSCEGYSLANRMSMAEIFPKSRISPQV